MISHNHRQLNLQQTPWTVLETSQGTHSYVGESVREEDELARWAYQFGRAEAEDHWW